jgi:cellulose synthase/poly-beta-1,6-N-acetylglucosamine synthase-like glycosyltransferase
VSTDGSLEYAREQAAGDERVVVIDKDTPPAGRGAAVSYGLQHAPDSDVVGFLDADHVLSQESMDALARAFGQAEPPEAIQGVCATADESSGLLPTVLTIERRWLEVTELKVTPRIGGVGLFGGGQGFLRRSLFDDPQVAIDDDMVLDDIDLSISLAMRGHRITFDPAVSTASAQPATVSELLDQRSRWIRGWAQMLSKHWRTAVGRGGARLGLRADLLRLMLTPFAGAWLWLGFGVALGALAAGSAALPLALSGLLWPLPTGLGPFLAAGCVRRASEAPVALLGMPLLFAMHCALAAGSVVDGCILRRPVSYAKTEKS